MVISPEHLNKIARAAWVLMPPLPLYTSSNKPILTVSSAVKTHVAYPGRDKLIMRAESELL